MKSAKQVDVFYKIQLLAQFGRDAADAEGVSSTLQLLAQCNTANCPLESAAVQIEMDAVIFLGLAVAMHMPVGASILDTRC